MNYRDAVCRGKDEPIKCSVIMPPPGDVSGVVTPQMEIVIKEFFKLQSLLLSVRDECTALLRRVSGEAMTSCPEDVSKALPVEQSIGYVASLSNMCSNLIDTTNRTQKIITDIKLAI